MEQYISAGEAKVLTTRARGLDGVCLREETDEIFESIRESAAEGKDCLLVDQLHEVIVNRLVAKGFLVTKAYDNDNDNLDLKISW